MTLPKFERQVRRMFAREQRETLTARRSVAKSGVKPGSNVIASAGTVIDAYMSLAEEAFARQYLADFSEVLEVRLSSQSSAPCYVFCSPSWDSTEYKPGDYVPLMDESNTPVSADSGDSSGDLRWFVLHETQRAPLRLTLSASASSVEMRPDAFAGPFSVALQVR